MSDKCSGENANNRKCCADQPGARVCSDGVKYVQKALSLSPKKAVLACEGGCIKGEVARVAANILSYKLQRDTSVRICLGDAATGDSGFIDLVNRAPQVIAIEGCGLKCGTEIMRKRIPDLKTTVIIASSLYEFDRNKYFEIFDMPREQIEEYAKKVADYTQDKFFNNCCDPESCSSSDCCN